MPETVDYDSRLAHVRSHASELWAKDTFRHPFFTLHGPNHCEQVEKLIGQILGDHIDGVAPKVDARQRFCLIASAWLHDVGMVSPLEDAEIEAASAQNASLDDWVRREHHERSYRYILRNPEALRLNAAEVSTVAAVCRAHGGERLGISRYISRGSQDLRLLSAVLRAADVLDISRARTPGSLMASLWKDMDPTSRWHWLKHWCVVEANPTYEVTIGANPPRLSVGFECVVHLPSRALERPFWLEVTRAISEVLEEQDVNLILAEVGVRIPPERISCRPEFIDHTMPGGESFEDCLRESLVPYGALPSLSRSLERIRVRNQTVARILAQELHNLVETFCELPEAMAVFKPAVETYLDGLAIARNAREVQRAKDHFCDAIRTTLHRGDWGKRSSSISQQCFRLAEIAWRLVTIVLGTDAERQTQLRHVLSWLPTECAALCRWLAEHDPSPEIRRLASLASPN